MRGSAQLRNLTRIGATIPIALAVTGCFGVVLSSGAPSIETPSIEVITTAPTYTPFPSNDQFALDLREAAGAGDPAGSKLDDLWTAIIDDAQLGEEVVYEAPTKLVSYRTGETPESACSSGIAARFWGENAFYCPTDKGILYDEAWLRDFADRLGSFAPIAIMAHEWGHHIQATLGITGLSIQTELQADCFGGLYLANTEVTTLDVDSPLGAEDIDAALVAFFELADDLYDASGWFQATAHGSQQQRILAFGTGYTSSFVRPALPSPVAGGLAPCMGYQAFTTRDFADIGPYYRLLNLPGRDESQQPEGYVIRPELRVGFDTSTVLLTWIDGDADDVVAQIGQKFPGLQPLAETISLDQVTPYRQGFAEYFEQRLGPGPTEVRSGMFALVQPRDNRGALVVLVYRQQAAVTELDASHAEQISTLYQVLGRLCGPDDSAEVGAPNLNTVCMDTQ